MYANITVDCNKGFGIIVNTVNLYDQFITYQKDDYFENFYDEVNDDKL